MRRNRNRSLTGRERHRDSDGTQVSRIQVREDVRRFHTGHTHGGSIERFGGGSITKRHRGVSSDVMITGLGRCIRGWPPYSGIGSNDRFFDGSDGWVRRRMSASLLTRWKTPKNGRRRLKRTGMASCRSVFRNNVMTVSYRKYNWRASRSPVVHRTLNNANPQGETGMYRMTDDRTKVQTRFPRGPLRNRRWVLWEIVGLRHSNT